MAAIDPVRRGGDLALRNIRTRRFQRSLAPAAAVGSVITAAEVYLEHDRAGFGNRVMWWPVWLGPVGAVAGALDPRAARTLLPIVSAAITANGLQGTWLHVRGIAEKPGGWAARYNVEMGPPLFAPMLMSLVGGMGLVADVLRRESRDA
ncbi:hypothetical protein ACH4E7_38140 [Kitasatospora sp. NPDC018058]|uniref:hypothetical protein n=1 Tax=Kitasatospora sp. NPDC018058 TaxID=3364025 RepID=UPI0037C0AD4F